MDHLVQNLAALDEGPRAVVALLLRGRIGVGTDVAHQEELQLTQGVEVQAGVPAKKRDRLSQDIVQGVGCRLAVLGQIAADEIQASGVEGVEESSPVNRHDVEVGQAHVHHALEQRGAVHPLAFGQDVFDLGGRGHGQLQFLDLAVQGGVVEGDALDVFVPDDLKKIGPLEALRLFVQQHGQRVGQGVGDVLLGHRFGS